MLSPSALEEIFYGFTCGITIIIVFISLLFGMVFTCSLFWLIIGSCDRFGFCRKPETVNEETGKSEKCRPIEYFV